jgi:sulfoxide reductase heme-binding subunit YedZ
MNSANWIFRCLLLAPVFGWVYLILFGDLGAEPVKELNHQTGFTALCYFLLNLWIGIVGSFSKNKKGFLLFLFKQRRYLGVLTFLILVGHLFFYLALEAFDLQALWQIIEKTYLIFGMTAFLGIALLAATSNDWSLKKLGGRKWRQLHRIVYPVAGLITVHIFLIEKADLILFASLVVPTWLALALRWMLAKPWSGLKRH